MPANRPATLTARLCCAALCIFALAGCMGLGSWQNAGFGRQEGLKNPVKTHLAFAKLSEKTGKFQAARDSYLTVLDEDPRSVEATIGLAGLDLRAGRTSDAERGFLKASELSPGNPVVSEALGRFYLSQDRYRDAEQFLSQGLGANPENRRLRYRLAVALAQQGRITEAEPLFVQTVGEAAADYNIGLILYEHGETVAAEQRLTAAVIKDATLDKAHHWLDVVRNERSSTMIAAGQQPSRQSTSDLPYGAINPVIRSEHSNQAALGSLNLAGRQALEQQQQQSLRQSGLQVSPGPTHVTQQPPRPAQVLQSPVQQYQTLDTSRMTPTQREQLLNSLTPEQRLALQQQLRYGQ